MRFHHGFLGYLLVFLCFAGAAASKNSLQQLRVSDKYLGLLQQEYQRMRVWCAHVGRHGPHMLGNRPTKMSKLLVDYVEYLQSQAC